MVIWKYAPTLNKLYWVSIDYRCEHIIHFRWIVLLNLCKSQNISFQDLGCRPIQSNMGYILAHGVVIVNTTQTNNCRLYLFWLHSIPAVTLWSRAYVMFVKETQMTGLHARLVTNYTKWLLHCTKAHMDVAR